MSKRRESNGKRQLKIVFDGVIALGPSVPAEGNGMGPFFGIMARSVRCLSDRAKRVKREKIRYTTAHIPTVFTCAKPTGASRPPDRILQISPCHPRWYMWHPIRERLEFRLDGDATPGPLNYLRGEKQSIARYSGTLGGKLSFWGIEHVPNLGQIWPERSVLLDGLLSADPGVSNNVIGQVLVPHGKVMGAGALKKGTALSVKFEPVRGCKSHPALVPNVAVGVSAKKVQIATYSLDSGEALDPIEFELTEDTEIWVSNGDPADVAMNMHKLSIEIANRMAERGQEVNERENEYVKQIAGGASLAEAKARYLNYFHGGTTAVFEGLTDHDQRSGNVDLDFEIFYTLMKNAHLVADGKGLPVPRRSRANEKFDGPDCYVTQCDTKDHLQFKSKP